MSTSALLLGLLFSSIGIGFFIYGKRKKALIPILCGIALMVFPYFMPSNVAMIVIGIILIAIPYFIRD